MSSVSFYSEYDLFAKIHNEFLGVFDSKNSIANLEELLLPYLSEGAHILDICCGTGQLVQYLLKKGYKVTGLDGSKEVLRYARDNAPGAEFIFSDVRSFKSQPTFDAVVSTNALYHVLNLDELKSIFHNVYAALQESGLFIFDLRLANGFQADDWDGTRSGDIKEDYAWGMQRNYNSEERIGRIDVTVFQLQGKEWQRSDDIWLLKGYFIGEIKPVLENVGFTEVSVYDSERFPELAGENSRNVYFVCRKLLSKSVQ